MTDITVGRHGIRSSFIEVVIYFAAFGMAYLERLKLYRWFQTTSYSPENAASGPKAIDSK
jgi:hypothetical protein